MSALATDSRQSGSTVEICPIRLADATRVGRFLHQHLNARISSGDWAAALTPKWRVDAPNHGYMLLWQGDVVGVQLAFYSERETPEGSERICNLAALCVHPDHRRHSFRLLMALLSQKGYSFTDLSPSGNVPSLNARLGFRALDTRTALVVNLPWPPSIRGTRLITHPVAIGATLSGRDLEIFRDHLDAQAAHQLVLCRDDRTCHVIFRRDRRKNLPLFASLLHVSDPELFFEAGNLVFRHLLVRHRIPFALAELRVVRYRPQSSILLGAHRQKMFRSNRLEPEAIDYLYSELTCVAW